MQKKRDRKAVQRLQHKLRPILEDAMRPDGAEFGKIRLAQPDKGTLEVHVHQGFSEAFIETFRELPIDDPAPSAQAARLGRRVTIPDLEKKEQIDSAFLAAALEEGVRAMQATPIVSPSGEVLGTLATHFTKPYLATMASRIVLDFCAARAAAIIEDA